MDVLERVGNSRMMLEGKFPYPDARPCTDYAIGEMYEYRDAIMRQERTDDKRNNVREHNPREEIGQAMYMIVSALLRHIETERVLVVRYVLGDGNPERRDMFYYNAIISLAQAAGNFFEDKPDDAVLLLQFAWLDCVRLCHIHGWDVPTLITETCEAFERKHLGVQA